MERRNFLQLLAATPFAKLFSGFYLARIRPKPSNELVIVNKSGIISFESNKVFRAGDFVGISEKGILEKVDEMFGIVVESDEDRVTLDFDLGSDE